MSTVPKKFRRRRSYVKRDSRLTNSQERAFDTLWPQFGFSLADGMIDIAQTFNRAAPTYLEIGFGMGTSLLAVALAQPEKNFIGVETHKPGIGALLIGIQEAAIPNLRIFYGDVMDALEKCLPDNSLDGIQIFFPDPWPKRRHQPRRLIQSTFIQLLISKLKLGGVLYLATDWEDYARQMLEVLTLERRLTNVAGIGSYASRSPHRPVITKFEQRALTDGRQIWDLQFTYTN